MQDRRIGKTMTTSSKAEPILKLVNQIDLNLILVRHGEAGGSDNLKGLLGSSLTVKGKKQAARLAERFTTLPLTCIYTSDMARAYQTAKAVHAFHPETPFLSLPELREIAGFQIRGRPQARTTDERKILHEQRERVKRFALHLRQAHNPQQLIAIIAHNGVNGMLLSELCGIPYRKSILFSTCHTGVTFANISLNTPEVFLRMLGCTRHLPTSLITDLNVRRPK